MTNGDMSEAEAAYHSRLLTTALACVWLSVGGVIAAMALLLVNDHTDAGLIIVPLIITLLGLQIPGIIGATALSILGGMWRSTRDGVVTAVLLLGAVSANLILWPITVSLHGLGTSTCSKSCTVGTSTKDLWIGVGVQILVLMILLACTASWLSRVRPHGVRAVVAMLAIVCAASLLAIDLKVDGQRTVHGGPVGPTFPATGKVSVSNDSDQAVHVVYCPHRICTGQPAIAMSANATMQFTSYATASTPDSLIVLDGPAGLNCGLVQPHTDGVLFTSLLGVDGTGDCSSDIASLTVPH